MERRDRVRLPSDDDRSLRDGSGPAAIRRTRPRPSTAPRAQTARADGPRSQRHHVDGFIGGNRFPLIEPAAATFVYRGEADAVYLRRWMHGETDGLPLERLDGTDLWHLRVPVPKGARLEYKFDVVRDGTGAWINDPLNPEVATDPFGANSVCRPTAT